MNEQEILAYLERDKTIRIDMIEAIRRGVRKVFIIDGRIPHSILIETLTDEGIGTMFVSGENYEH